MLEFDGASRLCVRQFEAFRSQKFEPRSSLKVPKSESLNVSSKPIEVI